MITLMNWEQVEAVLASWNIKKFQLAKEIGISRRTLIDWQHADLKADRQEKVSQAVMNMVTRLRNQRLPFETN